jgi:hypothetical protein
LQTDVEQTMEATSKAAQTRECSEGLTQLKRQFDRWRAGRMVGERIPVDLWAGAVAAAVEHSAYRVAAELHLDYAVLKRRAALAGGKAAATELTPRFVELFAPAGPTTSATSQLECVVELDNARGAKMRVELNGKGLAGLAGLCSAFWSAS